MPRRRSHVVSLALVTACHAEVVESPTSPAAQPMLPSEDVEAAPTVAPHAAAPGRTRVSLRVLSCLPVGYGMACHCELGAPGQSGVVRARLEACVGNGDTLGLEAWLEQKMVRGALPLSMWIDVAPAPGSARYCGILILEPGTHQRVVDFDVHQYTDNN